MFASGCLRSILNSHLVAATVESSRRRALRGSCAPALVVALLSVGGAACAATINVRVQDNRFVPERIVARPGDIVHWTNGGEGSHTVSARVGFLILFDFELSPGQSAEWLVTGGPVRSPLQYVCLFHYGQGMVGWIAIR